MPREPVLHDLLNDSAAARREACAVEEADGSAISYAELEQLSDRVRDHLQSLGVRPGDRVGVWVRKSIDTVAAIFGILKTGAAYVPVDPSAPAARNAYIFGNCAVSAAVVEDGFAAELERDPSWKGAGLLRLPGAGGGRALRACLDARDKASASRPGRTIRPGPEDLAYILYTSGSTGRPKGVMLSHRSAVRFVDWCSATFSPRPQDRFSAHAPFHFDLSILDLYVSIKHGATLVLIGEELGKDPVNLTAFVARARISVWYSAPSILSLMTQRGKMEDHEYPDLRLVLFAGEVFPIVHLRKLKRRWPAPDYYNLYGPTETNVCTAYKVPASIPEQRTIPVPIGSVCSHYRGLVVDEERRPVDEGQEGELCIAGDAVMSGYWGDPEQTQRRFIEHEGTRWYLTGDVVAPDEDGDYRYIGRRDRMVKKRGYRVELGEIEACLSRHPEVEEVAVVALPHDELGLLVKAHLGTGGGKRLSVVRLKRFCSEQLPVYMVPDQFEFHAALPKTSTGKMDYQALAGRS